MACGLLSARAEWSRLVGWAILACHFPANVHRNVLEDALADFVERSRDRNFFVLRDSKLPSDRSPSAGYSRISCLER